MWDTVIHVVCIVGYSCTCSMHCGIQLYMQYALLDKVIHVVCIVWDAVIHVVCIVGYSCTFCIVG